MLRLWPYGVLDYFKDACVVGENMNTTSQILYIIIYTSYNKGPKMDLEVSQP